jgi:hypothetical protein
MKYPMIEKLGLEYWDEGGSLGHVLKTEDLENLLSSATRVYGWASNPISNWTSYRYDNNTDTALLIAIEPINQAVSKDEIRRALETVNFRPSTAEMLKRILAYGVKE